MKKPGVLPKNVLTVELVKRPCGDTSIPQWEPVCKT